MRPRSLLACLLLTAVVFGACQGNSTRDADKEVLLGQAPIELPQLEDNVRHDTLLIQTTFAMGDGTFLMVASHMDDTFEGLRLYHYRTLPDSNAEVLHVSPPGYDSWTMFPTFFHDPRDGQGWIILANLGEKGSWGQKVFHLDDHGFEDLGFLDVAFAETIDGGERLGNVARRTRIEAEGDALVFRFDARLLHLYDDLRGGLDTALPGMDVSYRWSPESGMVLWVKGAAHHATSGS